MLIINGKGVYGGFAFGKASVFSRQNEKVKRIHINDTDSELSRYETAKESALRELHELYDKAVREVGETNAQIFDIHAMMVEDEDFNNSVRGIIVSQKVNSEYAVSLSADNFSTIFRQMDDSYMRERAADVVDASNHILKNMPLPQSESDPEAEKQVSYSKNNSNSKTAPWEMNKEKIILCADDLAPSETVQLDKSNIAAFITAHGSQNSHTAILARTMNIPAIIGVGKDIMHIKDGDTVIADAYSGTVYINPDAETIDNIKKKSEDDSRKKELLQTYRGRDNITPDGRKIDIFANIGGINDIGAAILNDAGGIGLFRSEFLYLEKSDFPSEEEQFRVYKQVLESMAGKKVVVRTLDIGADKQIGYFGLDKEENPALGMRAIRICLTRPEIFRTQLRALFRASVYGTLAIMFPMIASLNEIAEIKSIVKETKKELDASGIRFSDSVELGIMVETPAAAVISDILAPEVDFFSIGTNDLTQYTLAADRQNEKIERFCDPHHPAIMRLIKLTADNAHRFGKWVGICGELGSDLSLTKEFLDIGIDELSVSPSMILPLREKVCNCNTGAE